MNRWDPYLLWRILILGLLIHTVFNMGFEYGVEQEQRFYEDEEPETWLPT